MRSVRWGGATTARKPWSAPGFRPEIRFAGKTDPDVVAALHQRAHELCYIANSVNFPVSVEPVA